MRRSSFLSSVAHQTKDHCFQISALDDEERRKKTRYRSTRKGGEGGLVGGWRWLWWCKSSPKQLRVSCASGFAFFAHHPLHLRKCFWLLAQGKLDLDLRAGQRYHSQMKVLHILDYYECSLLVAWQKPKSIPPEQQHPSLGGSKSLIRTCQQPSEILSSAKEWVRSSFGNPRFLAFQRDAFQVGFHGRKDDKSWVVVGVRDTLGDSKRTVSGFLVWKRPKWFCCFFG